MNKSISLQNSFLRLALGVVSLESVIRPKQILGCDTLNKDLIKLKVLSKAWTFAEISNLKETINFICEEVYNDSTVVERFELVRDLKINDVFIGKTFEDHCNNKGSIILTSHQKPEIRVSEEINF